MSKDIKIDFKQVVNEINKRAEKAKQVVLKEMLADTTDFVPLGKTGNLRKSGIVTRDGLEWTAEYAADVYYGYNEHKVGTREWFEAAKLVHMDKWMKSFQNEMNKG